MIEPIKPKITLAASEIQDGDIITVQKVLSDKEYVILSIIVRRQAHSNTFVIQD